MATHAQTRRGLMVLSAGIGSLLLIAAAMVAGANAAENDDLVSVTPRAQSAEEKAASETDKDKEGLIDHALRNAHGEVGAMIATDGSRAAYGTVTMPLGETGSLTLSGSTGRYRGYGYDDPRDCRRLPPGAVLEPLPPGAAPCSELYPR